MSDINNSLEGQANMPELKTMHHGKNPIAKNSQHVTTLKKKLANKPFAPTAQELQEAKRRLKNWRSTHQPAISVPKEPAPLTAETQKIANQILGAKTGLGHQ